MINRIRKSFSLKVFLLTGVILVVSNLTLLVSIYYLMPQLYTEGEDRQFRETTRKLKTVLTGTDIVNAGSMLNEFCKENPVQVGISDEDGNPVRIPGLKKNYELADDPAETVSFYSEEEGSDVYLKGTEEGKRIYVFQVQGADTASCFVAVLPMEQARIDVLLNDLQQVLPVIILIIFILSTLVSIIYTRYVTGPILKAAMAAEAMANMQWDHAGIASVRRDEIGTLIQNINHTSNRLKGVLEERDYFFSAASHELKTPITVLKGQLTGMLYNVGIYADREQYLEKALHTTEDMEQRVLNILDIARLDSVDLVVQKEKIDLCRIIREETGIYEDIMNDKSIELKTDFPDEAYIEADKKLLVKAIDNILQNAVKYSPPGAEIRINILLNDHIWMATVENTGTHIISGREQELFYPFYRLEESRNKKTGGSGLGLYIVKRSLDLQRFGFFIKNTDEGVLFGITFDNCNES